MFRYPVVLPADLASFGAHDAARAELAPPLLSLAASSTSTAEVLLAEAVRGRTWICAGVLARSVFGRPPHVLFGVLQCWGLLAAALVLDGRAQLGETQPSSSSLVSRVSL